MPPSILSSPFMDPTVLARILQNPNLSHRERLSLLQARLAGLTNATSPVASLSSDQKAQGEVDRYKGVLGEMQRVREEVMIRLEIVRLLMSSPARLVEAEAEAGVAEGRCKEVIKKYRKFLDGDAVGRPMSAVEGGNRLTDRQTTSTSIVAATNGDGISVTMESGVGDNERNAATEEQKDQVERAISHLTRLRIEALTLLAEVEESLGRSGRAKKRRDLAVQLQQEL